MFMDKSSTIIFFHNIRYKNSLKFVIFCSFFAYKNKAGGIAIRPSSFVNDFRILKAAFAYEGFAYEPHGFGSTTTAVKTPSS